MNRHVRYALLTPLVVTSVALPPALAQAAPVERAPGAPAAAPLAPTCKLENGSTATEYDIILTGFRAGQNVQIRGAERINTKVDQAGSFTEQDVKKGSYSVRFGGQNNRNQMSINCIKPARVTPVHISEIDITTASTTPATVDCSVAQKVTFKATLTGTGTGDVKLQWGSDSKSTNPVLKFTAPSTESAAFVVQSTPRAAATDPAPKVNVVVFAGGASDRRTFTLRCT
ncbi:hypothetical protein [Streptomyces sp. NPDC090022]|uniref:hypothetical protein n=1 Tax=Streptomyces sp. NPDC090022 TaxID=3365920 RepID=UPI0038301B3F